MTNAEWTCPDCEHVNLSDSDWCENCDFLHPDNQFKDRATDLKSVSQE
jgi:phage FluMu protein Com